MTDPKKDESDGVTQPEPAAESQNTEADAPVDEKALEGVAGGGIAPFG